MNKKYDGIVYFRWYWVISGGISRTVLNDSLEARRLSQVVLANFPVARRETEVEERVRLIMATLPLSFGVFIFQQLHNGVLQTL